MASDPPAPELDALGCSVYAATPVMFFNSSAAGDAPYNAALEIVRDEIGVEPGLIVSKAIEKDGRAAEI